MSIEIREELEADQAAVYELNAAAFPTEAEAKLVDALRLTADPCISLVAVDGKDLIGHIMFTPVTLDTLQDLCIMGLAPMAVSPARQRNGIGAQLVKAGLKKCRELGAGAVVVLGHAEYYPRFGFRPASQWNIRCEYDVPDEVFMLTELVAGHLRGYQGIIRYHPAFAAA